MGKKIENSCNHHRNGINPESLLSLLILLMTCIYNLEFPGGSDGKESVCNSGDLGSILGSG